MTKLDLCVVGGRYPLLPVVTSWGTLSHTRCHHVTLLGSPNVTGTVARRNQNSITLILSHSTHNSVGAYEMCAHAEWSVSVYCLSEPVELEFL